MFFFLLFELGIIVLIVAAFWKVFEKAGQPGWAAIVPIYNMYILLKIGGKPGWWLLLMLIPVMPTLPLATLVLLLRFSISQMDVPTRQSYTMAVVAPEERSAAAGITGVARTTGAAFAPLFAGMLFAHPALISLPFFIAGTLKILYDLLLYRAFVHLPPPDETR